MCISWRQTHRLKIFFSLEWMWGYFRLELSFKKSNLVLVFYRVVFCVGVILDVSIFISVLGGEQMLQFISVASEGIFGSIFPWEKLYIQRCFYTDACHVVLVLVEHQRLVFQKGMLWCLAEFSTTPSSEWHPYYPGFHYWWWIAVLCFLSCVFFWEGNVAGRAVTCCINLGNVEYLF